MNKSIILAAGIAVAGIGGGYATLDALKSAEQEKNSTRQAHEAIQKAQNGLKMSNLNKAVTGKEEDTISGNILYYNKPLTQKIVETKNIDESIINKYAEASKIILDANGNADIDCPALVATNKITMDECLKVHSVEFTFLEFNKETQSLNIEIQDPTIKSKVEQIVKNNNLVPEDSTIISIPSVMVSNNNSTISKKIIENETKKNQILDDLIKQKQYAHATNAITKSAIEDVTTQQKLNTLEQINLSLSNEISQTTDETKQEILSRELERIQLLTVEMIAKSQNITEQTNLTLGAKTYHILDTISTETLNKLDSQTLEKFNQKIQYIQGENQ